MIGGYHKTQRAKTTTMLTFRTPNVTHHNMCSSQEAHLTGHNK
jgi:hypothetical protein